MNPPIITTQAVSSITSNSATVNATLIDMGVGSITFYGTVYDTISHNDPGNIDPSSSGYSSNNVHHTSVDIGPFTDSLTALSPGTVYYLRALARNTQDWGYGNEVSFRTANLPPSSDFVSATIRIY